MLCGKSVRRCFGVALAMVGVASFAGLANAAIVVSNGSFEDPSVTAAEGYQLQMPTGWSRSANATEDPTVNKPATSNLYAAAAAGTQIMALEGNYFNWVSPPAWSIDGVQQDVGSMAAGKTYAFGADLFSCSGTSHCFYKVSLYNATDSRELASIDETNFDPSALGTKQTLHASFSYTALAADQGDTLRLIMESKAAGTFFSVNNGALTGYANRTGIDNVTITESVPEPSTLVLAITGLIGLVCYAWRKHK
jgi:hypothetical protein